MGKAIRGQKSETESAVKLSIWDRNIQFAFWSIVFGILSLFMDRTWMEEDGGLFHGFSSVTIVLVMIWTAGGLLVAMTIKYTNVIIKGFASAMSLILICICGSMFLGDYLDLVFLIGATVTIIATFNYNDKESTNYSANAKKMTPSDSGSSSVVIVDNDSSKLYPI